MGSIHCDKESCEYNSTAGLCRRGSGYDYGGGDIQINKNGHCVSSERKKIEKIKRQRSRE